MAKTISELKAQSAEVKNASAIGENTATRVGQLFGDIVEHVEQYEQNKDTKDASQDTTMQSLVSAEESRAKGEERGLTNQIHAEEINRQTADAYLSELITNETSARATADDSIKTALNNEITRAKLAEQELAVAEVWTNRIQDGAVTTPKIADGAVTYEKTNIIAQELSDNEHIVPSSKVVKANIDGLVQAYGSETILREQGDEELNAAIKAESERAQSRENDLTTAIQQETDRAMEAEEVNATSIIDTDRIADGAVTVAKLKDVDTSLSSEWGYSDLAFTDENKKAILSVQDGYPKTKNFSGKSTNESIENINTRLEDNEEYHIASSDDDDYSDLAFTDENKKAILSVQDGYPKTKNFSGKSTNESIENINTRLNEVEKELEIISQNKPIPYRTFSILGDSYSTFKGFLTPNDASIWYPRDEGDNDVINVEETWWHLFATELNIRLIENVSWSGAPICYDGYGSGTIDAKTSSFVTRLQYITDPELLIIFGGTNDSWIGVGMGEYEYENWSDDNLIYFRPSLAKLLHDAKDSNIGMKILFVLNTGLSSDINTSVKTICEHYNVSLLELANIEKQAGHPSKAGMIAIKNQIINFL